MHQFRVLVLLLSVGLLSGLPVSANLLSNGDFGSGTTDWTFTTNGDHDFTVESGIGRIAVVDQGTVVQLYQQALPITTTTKYRVLFDARNDNGDDTKVQLHQQTSGLNYGLNVDVNLTTVMTTYRFDFTSTNGSNVLDARFRFRVDSYDQDNTNYYFDNVILETRSCGDGVIDVVDGEECDDGNTSSNDGCSSSCITESVCGDGIHGPGEECDDGNGTNGDGCDNDCTLSSASSSSASSAVIYVSDHEGCPSGDPTPGSPCTDRDIWELAIEAARTGGTLRRVVGEGTRLYRFADTLVIDGLQHGIIDGNGAGFHWESLVNGTVFAAPSDRPMFRISNSKRLLIQNMDIRVNVGTLETGFEFSNDPNVGHSSTRNELHHIAVTANPSSRLDFGVRFPESSALNNDQMTISHCAFFGVYNAAVAIEGKESLNHRLINVTASGGPSNLAPNSAYVRVTNAGSFESIGGFAGGFSEANFVINSSTQRILIIDHTSEKSARMIKAYELASPPIPNAANFANAVSVLGGRFSIDHIDADGHYIDFELRGPLVIDGLTVDGVTRDTPNQEIQPEDAPATDAKVPRIRYEPQGTANGISVLQVTGVNFYWLGATMASENYDPIVLGANARLVSYANMCRGGSAGNWAQSVECGVGYGVDVYSATGMSAADLPGLTPRVGHWTFCSDCNRDASCSTGGTGALAVRVSDGAGGETWACD